MLNYLCFIVYFGFFGVYLYKGFIMVKGFFVGVAICMFGVATFLGVNSIYKGAYNAGYEAGKIETIKEVWAVDSCVIQMPIKAVQNGK